MDIEAVALYVDSDGTRREGDGIGECSNGHLGLQFRPELYDMGKNSVREIRTERYLYHIDIGEADLIKEPGDVGHKCSNFFRDQPVFSRFLKKEVARHICHEGAGEDTQTKMPDIEKARHEYPESKENEEAGE